MAPIELADHLMCTENNEREGLLSTKERNQNFYFTRITMKKEKSPSRSNHKLVHDLTHHAGERVC